MTVGERWEVEIKLHPMRREDAAKWIAFLVSLNGMEGALLK